MKSNKLWFEIFSIGYHLINLMDFCNKFFVHCPIIIGISGTFFWLYLTNQIWKTSDQKYFMDSKMIPRWWRDFFFKLIKANDREDFLIKNLHPEWGTENRIQSSHNDLAFQSRSLKKSFEKLNQNLLHLKWTTETCLCLYAT
jgi:hypothetical protein